MNLAEMAAARNMSVPFDADLDHAEEQIGQDCLVATEEWLAAKVQAINQLEDLTRDVRPEEKAVLERALSILQRDYTVTAKVFNDPKLREILKTVGWRWAALLKLDGAL